MVGEMYFVRSLVRMEGEMYSIREIVRMEGGDVFC